MRIISATKYALEGVVSVWKSEAAFRQEVIVFSLAYLVSFSFALSIEERLFLLFTSMLVLVVELMNSAVEAAIDRIGPETHPLSKVAKDAGAAAVFFSILLAVLTWGVILVKHIL